MRRKKWIQGFSILLLLSLCAILAAGCRQSSSDESETNAGTIRSTENPFIVTEQEETQETDQEEETEIDILEKIGNFSVGLQAVGGERDKETGWRYFTYEGGEMKMTYTIQSTLKDYGIGLMVYLDGDLQLCRLEGESEYSAMHVFYPSEDEDVTPSLYFVPSIGEAGDELEICTVLLPGILYAPDLEAEFKGYGNLYKTSSAIGPIRFLADIEGTAAGDSEETEAVTMSVEYRMLEASDLKSYAIRLHVSEEKLYAGAYAWFHETGDLSSYLMPYNAVDGQETAEYQIEMVGVEGARYHVAALYGGDVLPDYSCTVELTADTAAIIHAQLDLTQIDLPGTLLFLLIPENWMEYRDYSVWVIASDPTYLYQENP